MLSFSGATWAEYNAAVAHKNKTHIKMEFESGTVLTDQDIDLSVGATVTDSFNPDSDIKYGNVACKEFSTQIILTDRTNAINWTENFDLYFGVEDDGGTTIWVYYGTFKGKRPKRLMDVSVVQFTAYNMATLLDANANDFLDSISYPTTIEDIYSDLIDEIGYTHGSMDVTLNIWNRQFTQNHFKNNSYTFKEIASHIAEAAGCYIKIQPRRNGMDAISVDPFERNYLSNPITRDRIFSEEHADMYADFKTWDEFDTYTWNDVSSTPWNDIDGFYTGQNLFDAIYVNKTDNGVNARYPSNVKTGHIYEVKDNAILLVTSGNKTSHINNYVKPILERLQAFGGILPMTVECYGDFTIEAGDIVKVELKDGFVWMPIFYKTMHWNGMPIDTYETTAPDI